MFVYILSCQESFGTLFYGGVGDFKGATVVAATASAAAAFCSALNAADAEGWANWEPQMARLLPSGVLERLFLR